MKDITITDGYLTKYGEMCLLRHIREIPEDGSQTINLHGDITVEALKLEKLLIKLSQTKVN